MARDTTVLGIDSSTQSTKAVVVRAATGEVLSTGRAAHPDGTEVHPDAWWSALAAAVDGAGAVAGAGANSVAAVSVAAQQHGMVVLDGDGEVVRPALLWNDTRSAPQAARLVAELGAEQWASRTGVVPVASFTVTKLAWLAEHEPAHAARVARVLLPHDWLGWRLAGRWAEPGTDAGDASGTGYFSAADRAWLPDLLAQATGLSPELPRLLGPAEPLGTTVGGALPADLPIGPGTGDNAAAALGLGAGPGDVVVSLGTSGTVFAVTDRPSADPSGIVAGFCDATGRHLPLVCTLNAARVLVAAAALLGTDLPGLDALALSAAPGAGGLTVLPYLDGERTPDLPGATGTLGGLTRTSMTPANLARAAVEGMLCGLADGLDALRAQGVEVRRVLLIGGAAGSAAVQAAAPGVLGAPVVVPDEAEYVALGAARQAAWLLAGGAEPPDWPVRGRDLAPSSSVDGLRERYAELREQVHGRG